VTETHIHADFLSGVRQVGESLGATVYLSDAGTDDWKYRWPETGAAYDVVKLRDGDEFRVGNVRFRALHTPGHTPEHLSFLVHDEGGGASVPMGVVTGDFVFVGALGRPDLLETAAGLQGMKEFSARQLAGSAKNFLSFDDYLQVWPGHGAGSACGKALGAVPQSTVGYERRFNVGLGLASDQDRFVSYILADQPSPPLYFARMKHENRDGVPRLKRVPEPQPISPSALPDDVVVVDTRTLDAFVRGHLPGSIAAPLGPQLAASAGSYVIPEQTIAIVAEAALVEDVTRVLVRIGLDRVEHVISPADVEADGARTPLALVSTGSLARAVAKGAYVLDVRNPDEHAQGTIPGATNIAYTRLLPRLAELPRDREIFVHCQSGSRAILAGAYLAREGFDVQTSDGGVVAWQQEGLELVAPAPTT